MKLPVKYSETPFWERKVVRERYVEVQKGLCWFCNRPLSGPSGGPKVDGKRINKELFPETFFKWPIHLHHDHDTDLTIGAVHNKCNAILWQHYGQ